MRVGIVGGIGSGKSEVLAILRSLGATVLDADAVNRTMFNDPDYIAQISHFFPAAVRDGVVDIAALRQWVFSSDANRLALEQVAHPLIRQKLLEATDGNSIYCIEISAYRPSFMPLDEVWLVTANPSTRILRVQARSGWPIAQIEQVMEAQAPSMPTQPDCVISNDGTLEQLRRQVLAQYQRVLAGL